MPKEIIIVGGGPIGLTSAYALVTDDRTTKCNIAIVDAGDKRKTAGMSAGAFVDPDWDVNARYNDWLHKSMEFYNRMAADRRTGVVQMPMHVLRGQERELQAGERRLTANELLPGFPCGTTAQTFRINPPVFLERLRSRLQDCEVGFHCQQVVDFGQIIEQFGRDIVIVDAAGVGARELAKDDTLVPARGHCLRVRLDKAPQQVRLVAREHTWLSRWDRKNAASAALLSSTAGTLILIPYRYRPFSNEWPKSCPPSVGISLLTALSKPPAVYDRRAPTVCVWKRTNSMALTSSTVMDTAPRVLPSLAACLNSAISCGT